MRRVRRIVGIFDQETAVLVVDVSRKGNVVSRHSVLSLLHFARREVGIDVLDVIVIGWDGVANDWVTDLHVVPKIRAVDHHEDVWIIRVGFQEQPGISWVYEFEIAAAKRSPIGLEDRGIESRTPAVLLVESKSIAMWPPLGNWETGQEGCSENGRRYLADSTANIAPNALAIDHASFNITLVGFDNA